MTEPIRLQRAREATIPTAKLVSYALDRSHERGTHKARVFASALGITADWRYVHDQILAKLPNAVVRSTRITPFGVAYEVIVMIDGLNGRTAPTTAETTRLHPAPARRARSPPTVQLADRVVSLAVRRLPHRTSS
jgi:hypothetical protein